MSLLTQFYPGPGGGGGGTVLAGTTGFSSIVLQGVSGAFPTVGAPFVNPAGANGFFFINTTAGVPGYPGYTGGSETGITLNNIAVNSFSPGTNLSSLVLNGATITTFGGAGTCPITSIQGTGVIRSKSGPGGANLTTISTGIAFIPGDSTYNNYSFFLSSLDAASVNHILESLVANGGTNTTGTVDLSAGTSAGTSALTAAGTAAVAALTGAGWTVTLNP